MALSAGNYTAASFAPAIDCMLRESRSQHFADLALITFLLKAAGYQPGTFVELGALDGVKFSNTLALERCFGWRGLLIEGMPSNFARLKRSGRAATPVHATVCNATDSPEGRSVYFSTGHGRAESHAESVSSVPRKGVVAVPCRPLTSVLETAGVRHVHLFVLDVEGYEWQVISSVPPSELSRLFSIIYVELNGKDPAKDTRVHEHILRSGFVFARYTGAALQTGCT
jgi:FkbM family methyltransferase